LSRAILARGSTCRRRFWRAFVLPRSGSRCLRRWRCSASLGRWRRRGRGLGIELFFIVALDRTPPHDRGANPFFHDVLLFVLVEGSLHAFDVDWF
jgi:hypothetical protein